MKDAATLLRERLDAESQGKGRRPRGNSVTAEEHGAVLPFAQALDKLVSETLHGGHDDRFDENEEREGRISPPPEALPPLP